MGTRQMLLVVFVSSVYLVSGQYIPSAYPWDCRRPSSTCKGTNSNCTQNTGQCICSTSDTAYDCGLPVGDQVTCPTPVNAGSCQNNANCTKSESCYCTSNTYGDKCQNGRVNVKCNEEGMFINIYPHGDASFKGILFLNNLPTTGGRDNSECHLKLINDTEDTDLRKDMEQYGVTDVQGNPTTLRGYYIALSHTSTVCENALVTNDNDTGRMDYIRKVVVEYNTNIISSLDQVHVFNCSVSSTSSSELVSSVNSMSVTIEGEDYQQVNATDTIEPITFEIRNPVTDAIITSSIHLGDALDLVFFLSNPAPPEDKTSTNLYSSFFVSSCTATNGQPATSIEFKFLQFLKDGCPTGDSALLYRDSVAIDTTGDVIKEIIPINAFRFVGTNDAVAFTCQVKLCTPAEEANDAKACSKPVCPGDSPAPGDGNAGGGDSPAPDDGNAGGGDSTAAGGDNAGGGGDSTAAGGDNAGGGTPAPTPEATPGTRRKRGATDSTDEVSKTIHVTSGYDVGNSDTNQSTYNESNCMLHSDVINIVVIFSVILCLLVIVVVVLVARLLRSRTKVVDSSDMSAVSHSNYPLTIPRLSMNTSYNNM